jgi:H+/Cl- antiporter ClcA
MTARRRSVAAIVWGGVAAVIAVSVVLAPIRTVGWCAFASDGGGSVCSDRQESLIGIESTPWLWLAGVAAVVVLTVVAARRRARQR